MCKYVVTVFDRSGVSFIKYLYTLLLPRCHVCANVEEKHLEVVRTHLSRFIYYFKRSSVGIIHIKWFDLPERPLNKHCLNRFH